MTPPRILMATFRPWDTPLPLGAHSLAHAFVRAGWAVGFVSNPMCPVELVKDPRAFARQLRGAGSQAKGKSEGRLWVSSPFAVVGPHNAPLLRSRALHRGWHRLTVPNVVRRAHADGFGEVDLLYIDSPIHLFWLGAIEHKASVARIADLYSAFAGVAPEVLKMEGQLISSVDLVAHTSTGLEEHVKVSGAKRTLFLSNGVDVDAFGTPQPRPAEYEGIDSPIAVYAGQFGNWLAYDLLDQVAASLPHVTFVYIGPPQLARDRLEPRANVRILGWRAFESLPAYLQHAHVGLMPYDVVNHYERLKTVNSLKLYQYFAAGLPVVATRWPEVERQSPPVLVADTAAEFASAIHDAMAGVVDLDECRRIASDNSWGSRVKMLLDAVGMDDRGMREAPAS